MKIYSFLSTLRKSVGYVALSCLSVVFLVFPFLLSSVTYASPANGGFTFGSSQALDQASVSVVRIVASYSTTPSSSSSNVNGSTPTSSTQSTPPANITPIVTITPPGLPIIHDASPSAAECTSSAIGLGVLVGSWSPQSPTELNTWVLTDGSVVNEQGVNAPGCNASNTAPLTSIAIYTSDAYNSTQSSVPLVTLKCSTSGCGKTIVCQTSSPCASGSVLLNFHTTYPQPYIDLALTSQVASQGVELVETPTTSAVTPTPTMPTLAQVPQSLYPLLVDFNPGVDEKGMPLVNDAGQLVSMDINHNEDATVTGFVGSKVTSLQRQNALRVAWNKGITDEYVNHNPGNIANDFSGALSANPQFTAFSAFSQNIQPGLGTPSTGTNGTPGVHASPTATSNQTNNLFGIPLPSWTLLWLALLGFVLLVVLFVLITFVLMRRQAVRRREEQEFAAAERRAEKEAPIFAEQERAQSQQQQNWPSQGQPQPQANHVPAIGSPPTNVLPPVPIVQASPDLRCPNCKQPVRPGDNFCPNCRTPLIPGEFGANAPLVLPAPPDAPMPPPRISAPLPDPNLNALPALPMSEQPTLAIQPGGMKNGQAPAESGAEPETAPLSSRSVRHFTGSKISMSVGTRSNAGIKRKHKPNEDSLFAVQGERMHNSESQQFGLFVVADGMGGHANGQEASRLAIKTIEDFMVTRLQGSDQLDDETYVKLLTDGVQAANVAVHTRNLEHHADMGTTMTAVLIIGTTAYVANVGDSRTYLYRKPGPLRKITHDHSVVASLVEAGIIQPDDIYTHPKRNQIYRSLGEKEVIEVDTFIERLQPDDKLLLCSDGLWDMVRDPTIEQVLSAVPDPSQTGNALIQAALDGGGEDNVSVIIVQVTEATQRTGLTGIQFLARPENPQWPPMP